MFSLLSLAACADEDDVTRGAAAALDSAVMYAVMIRETESLNDYLSASPGVPNGEIDLSNAIELTGGNFYSTPEAVYYGRGGPGFARRLGCSRHGIVRRSRTPDPSASAR